MDNRGNKGRPVAGVRCTQCHDPIYDVCEHCSGLSVNGGVAAFCSRPNRQAAAQPRPKSSAEEKPQAAVASGSATSGSTFLTMLRHGSKMLERMSKNVATAKGNFFGVEEDEDEEEEDIDRAVEEYKKAQLEEQEKNKQF